MYVTPVSYISFLRTVRSLMNAKRNEIATSRMRYANGIEKIEFSEGAIATMQAELRALQPELEKTSAETAVLIDVVAKGCAVASLLLLLNLLLRNALYGGFQ